MLAVEFMLENPQGGLRFIKKNLLTLNNDDKDVYLCTIDHNPHYWFPCVNTYNEPCTWKIEVTVEEDYSVIASGNLIEVETISSPFSDSNTNFKKYHYFLQVPTCAPNIGLVIGNFDSMNNETVNEICVYFDLRLKDLIKTTSSFLHEIFEFFEETLSITYPYGSYKQIYVPDILEQCISYASMSIIKYDKFFIPTCQINLKLKIVIHKYKYFTKNKIYDDQI